MMYNLANKMAKISHFMIMKNNILIAHNGNFYVNSQILDISPILYQGDTTDDNIWIKDSNWDNYLLDISNNTLRKLDFSLGLNGKISNIIVIFKDNIQSCFSIKDKKILVDFPEVETIKNYISDNEHIYIQVENTLSSLSLLTGLYSWQVDLNLERIVHILGVFGDNLIVNYEDREAQTGNYQAGLLALDIHTGKEIWRTLAKDTQDFFPVFSPDKSTAFNLHTGHSLQGIIIRTRGVSIFREFDLSNGNIKREGLLDEFDALGLIIKKFVLEGDKIYFTAAKGVFVPSIVGVLDYETLSLLWWEEVKMDEADGFGNFLTQIQVSENNIYVLDKTGTLHIYEKDDTKPYQKPAKSGLMPFEDVLIPKEPPYYPENDVLPF